jgi:hypothetical protein
MHDLNEQDLFIIMYCFNTASVFVWIIIITARTFSWKGLFLFYKLIGDPVFVDIGKKYEKTSAHILYRWAIEHDVGMYEIQMHLHICEYQL